METVEQLMKKDGRNQCLTGAVLFLIGGVSLIASLTTEGISLSWAVLLYGVPALAAGIYFVQSGWKDLVKAERTEDMAISTDKGAIAFSSVPAEMYLGKGEDNGARFFTMDGEAMGDVTEKTTSLKKTAGVLLSLHSANFPLPAVYEVREDGELLYEIEKKGFSFTTKAYVKQGNGTYVAIMKAEKDKETKQMVYTYQEKDQVLYQAAGDGDIGRFPVKDEKGTPLVTVKKGAIPVGGADALQRMHGSVLEWERRENIPYSLLLFLFFIEHQQQ
ncbi:hypothetical protein [Salimicrobium halophilum]|uniref:Uncharacterized protein n=1 Tax=Salimicrobium halophilum TaxID=86666 RepID=A0A1G8V4X0_9BACI|nr:hypothetical protein [Salimicrobium halophilum]SDJ61186.1 hypothetical protein SAMN04490247_2509 [Salimicrobium halophilum]